MYWSRSVELFDNRSFALLHLSDIGVYKAYGSQSESGVAMNVIFKWSRSNLQNKSDNLWIILTNGEGYSNINNNYASFLYGVARLQ